MRRLFVPLILSAATTACGTFAFKKDDQASVSHNSFKYHLIENDCDTGEHAFDSHIEYCRALTNDSLNGKCALDLRITQLKADCGAELNDGSVVLPKAPT